MAIYGECCYGRCPNFTTEISKCDKVMDNVINRILIFWSNTNIIGKHAQYQSRVSGRLDVWVPNNHNVNILCVLSTDDWLADYLLTIPSPRERVLCMCGACHMSHVTWHVSLTHWLCVTRQQLALPPPEHIFKLSTRSGLLLHFQALLYSSWFSSYGSNHTGLPGNNLAPLCQTFKPLECVVHEHPVLVGSGAGRTVSLAAARRSCNGDNEYVVTTMRKSERHSGISPQYLQRCIYSSTVSSI